VTPATRMVAALLPASWPARASALVAAGHLDRLHGQESLDLVLRSWAAWRDTGALPAERWLVDLLLELQAFLAGGLEPRLPRRAS